MKRFILLIVIATLTLSCSDTLTRDEPIFQTMIDNDIYRSQDAFAALDDEGHLTIQSADMESIMFKTESDQPGIYTLATTGVNSAQYETPNDVIYTSQHSKIDGTVEILRAHEKGYDGKFNFNLVNTIGDTVVMHKGAFFDVPLTNQDIEEPGELPTEYLIASIGGLNFESHDVVRTETDDDKILIVGSFDGAEISISYAQNLEAGTYAIGDEPSLTMAYFEGESSNEAVSGELTINPIEEDLYTGEFTFETEFGLEITSGEFSVQ